jgi:dipeptidyl aminopeptidase/acylaminoacyl peptidase
MRMLALTLLSLAAAGAALAAPANAADRPFTAHDLVSLDRLGGPRLAPNGVQVLYDLRSTDLAANRGAHAMWLAALGGTMPTVRLGVSDGGATDAQWSGDGRWIYFLSGRSGSTQVWRTDGTGQRSTAVTHLPGDVQAYRVTPDGRRIIVSLPVFADCPDLACTARRETADAASKATGTVYDRVFVRHWDTWADGTDNHLFSLPLGPDGTATGTAASLMRALDGDVTSKPFGDESDFVISPDSRTVVFSMRLAGSTEPWSTNFDLWRVPIDGSVAPADITADNPAWDANPVFSPDGNQLAYRAQSVPGFESDRSRIMVRDLRTGHTTEIAHDWDRSADALAWSSDGRTIYATAQDVLDHRLFAIDVASSAVKPLTAAGSVEGFDVGKNLLVYSLSTLDAPAQIFALPTNGRDPVQITHANADRLRGVELAPFESFTFAGWNGDTVHGFVMKPAGYTEGQHYPVAFIIHGGPEGSFGDGWGYRWNPQTYAGRGYAVVSIDFHGSTGYGHAFTSAIDGHWGDRPLEDLQKGWSAALARFSYLDQHRACALGASYGGYMIYWIAGNWKQPWRCLVAHDGVFDNRIMGYATDELWFSEWENGGSTVWEHPENYERFNPLNHVADWSVPMLIVHSARDYRIPLDQGIAAFTALQRRGIPSEFLTFPDENHWVLKPANSLLWHQTVEDWLQRWTR